MEDIRLKFKVKDGVIYDGQDFSRFTGETILMGYDGIWVVEFDKESVERLSKKYIEDCKKEGAIINTFSFTDSDIIIYN